MFVNLLNNAFYAVRKRELEGASDYAPTVRIETRSLDGGNAEVRIRDNGIGIPDVEIDHLFTPFFTTKPPGEGTGLGLSISHDIVVEQHGGTLRAESAPGEFTEFIIALPAMTSGTQRTNDGRENPVC